MITLPIALSLGVAIGVAVAVGVASIVSQYVQPYSFVRARSLRSLLTKPGKIEELISSTDQGFTQILSSHSLSEYYDLANVSSDIELKYELSKYIKNIYNSTTLLSSEKEKAFLNLYSSSVDVLTYKLLIAKWLKGDPDPDTSSIPKTTIFDDELINKILTSKDTYSLTNIKGLEKITHGLESILEEARLSKNTSDINKIYYELEHKFYKSLLYEAKKIKSESLERFLKIEIDLLNLEKIIRGLNLGVNPVVIQSQLIPIQYKMHDDIIKNISNFKDAFSFLQSLDIPEYKDVIDVTINTLNDDFNPIKIRNVFRNYLVKYASKAFSKEMFSVTLIASLIKLQLFQIEVLETIFRGKQLNLENDKISTLVEYFEL